MNNGKTLHLADGCIATIAHLDGKVCLTLQTPRGLGVATFTGHELRELFEEAGSLHDELTHVTPSGHPKAYEGPPHAVVEVDREAETPIEPVGEVRHAPSHAPPHRPSSRPKG